MNRNILITGGAGFIGSQVVRFEVMYFKIMRHKNKFSSKNITTIEPKQMFSYKPSAWEASKQKITPNDRDFESKK